MNFPDRSVVTRSLHLGLLEVRRAELESLKVRGERLAIKVLGLLRIDNDVSGELAASTIESITLLGSFQASENVKSALADKLK